MSLFELFAKKKRKKVRERFAGSKNCRNFALVFRTAIQKRKIKQKRNTDKANFIAAFPTENSFERDVLDRKKVIEKSFEATMRE